MGLCAFFTRIRVTPILLIIVLFLFEQLYADNNTATPTLPQKKELIWSDEFEQNGHPDFLNWNFEYGFIRNHELQWYQPQNASCKNGLLIIEGKKEKVENPNYNPFSQDWRVNRQYAQYTSACLITKNLHEWPAYGYYEIRCRIDVRKGSWPAIWLLGTEKDWPDGGEIDIMEFYRINNIPHLLANVAWGSDQPYKASWNSLAQKISYFIEKKPEWPQKFHTWSMKWDEDYIQLYVDGELLNKVGLAQTVDHSGYTPFKSDNKFYLLLNLAIGSNGGDPDDSAFPLKFEIDYVRVYKLLGLKNNK